MATIADLNVRIGAIFAPLEKGLSGAEAALKKSGRRFEEIGSRLSLSLTAPLGLLGQQAIKAAGDFESLTLALEGQIGSAEKAKEELLLLQEAAKAPGLAFEQAVRGSVQLQAVGLSAEQARRTIQAFGNGLALAGKSGQDLDGVILALTQISAKGVISAEEINQIAERLPQIRTLLKDAFGTANTEELQKLGVTAEQFIELTTRELEKLPKATGGIKNSFDNLRDSLNQSLARIGFAINEAFDVQGLFDRAGKAVDALAKAFDGLSDSNKRAVIGLAAVATGIGPILFAIGSLRQLGAIAASGLLTLTNGLKAVTAQAILASRAFQALSVAQRATIIGLGIAAITAAAIAYSQYQDKVNSVTAAQRALNDVNQTAEENIVTQRVEAERLTKIVANQNSTYDEQRKALDQLAKIAPEYYGSLDRTKISVEEVEKATRRYVDSLLLQAKIQAAKDELVEYEKQLINVRKNSDPTIFQQVANGLLGIGSAGAAAALNAKDYGENVVENRKQITEAKTALEQYLAELIKQAPATDGAGASNERFVGTIKKTETELRKEAAALEKRAKDLREQIGLTESLSDKPLRTGVLQGQTINEIQTNIDVSTSPSLGAEVEALTAFNELLAATGNNVTTFATGYAAAIEGINAGTISFQDAFSQTAALVAQNGTAMQQVTFGVLDSLGRLAADGSASFAEYANAAVDAGKQVIGILIKEGIAAAVTRALTSGAAALNPIAALALASAAGIGAQAIFSGLLNKVKIPALAEGGVTTRPTLAMVGDNPGGREAIIPLNKLPGLIRSVGGGQGGFIAETTVRGQDLLILLKRAENSNNRLT